MEKILEDVLNKFRKETNSEIAKKILNNYENELKYFKQICPVEMLDKLDHPITNKALKKKLVNLKRITPYFLFIITTIIATFFGKKSIFLSVQMKRM